MCKLDRKRRITRPAINSVPNALSGGATDSSYPSEMLPFYRSLVTIFPCSQQLTPMEISHHFHSRLLPMHTFLPFPVRKAIDFKWVYTFGSPEMLIDDATACMIQSLQKLIPKLTAYYIVNIKPSTQLRPTVREMRGPSDRDGDRPEKDGNKRAPMDRVASGGHFESEGWLKRSGSELIQKGLCQMVLNRNMRK
ncbi:hypothetical protein GWI33_011981 [Rhynchophorus ferrugineus]|uniref:Uncharacterized protein n=1 Tax=Rhynchophorus ferrugineus TaxID=354439 RepID=A0A834IWI0_RHYFE|nr:hypothetical protein GWI33_011981 [Rhynchophorus ferrugineus]